MKTLVWKRLFSEHTWLHELSGCGGGEILVPSATWQQEQNHHFKVKPSEISTENSVYLQQVVVWSKWTQHWGPPLTSTPLGGGFQGCRQAGMFLSKITPHCWKGWGDDWSDFRIFRADGMSCFKAWGTLSTPERWGTSLSPSCQRRSAVPTPTFKQKQQYL